MLWVGVILSTVVGSSAGISHARAGSVPTLNRWVKYCIPDHGCFHQTSSRLWDLYFPNTKFKPLWPGRPGSWYAYSMYLSSSLKWSVWRPVIFCLLHVTHRFAPPCYMLYSVFIFFFPMMIWLSHLTLLNINSLFLQIKGLD